MKINKAVQSAVQAAGGQAALARRLSVKRQTVHDWILGRRKVPAERCIDIAGATGVPVENLRPDFPWGKFRAGA
jgi:DNA-binding transcriptional regulator YdaS (Cro superfamily)